MKAIAWRIVGFCVAVLLSWWSISRHEIDHVAVASFLGVAIGMMVENLVGYYSRK